MFGENTIQKQDLALRDNLRVVGGAPFLTIQGEGPFQGKPAAFIRLNGCNLRCTFCDTYFDNPDDPLVSIEGLVEQVERYGVNLCVLTGGEPLRQDVRPLVRALTAIGVQVQIETAGTLWLTGLEDLTPYVVVSPKTPALHYMADAHALAFKYVVSSSQDFDDYGIPIAATQPGASPRPLAAPSNPGLPIYYSPMDEYDAERNKANASLAAHLALSYNRLVTLQMHKYLGLD